MEIEVSARGGEEEPETYVGLQVRRGPGVLRLLLTEPYRSAGQVLDIPLDRVEAIEEFDSSADETLG